MPSLIISCIQHKPLKHFIKAVNQERMPLFKDQNIVVETPTFGFEWKFFTGTNKIQTFLSKMKVFENCYDEYYHHTFHKQWHFAFGLLEDVWWEQCPCQGRSPLLWEEPEQWSICFEYKYETVDPSLLEKNLNNDHQYHIHNYLVQVSSNDNYQHSDKIWLVCISPELPLLKLWKPLQELLNKGRI